MTICMPEACNKMPLMEDTKSVLFLGFKFAWRCNEESAEKPKRSCLVTKTERNEEKISVSKSESIVVEYTSNKMSNRASNIWI